MVQSEQHFGYCTELYDGTPPTAYFAVLRYLLALAAAVVWVFKYFVLI